MPSEPRLNSHVAVTSRGEVASGASRPNLSDVELRSPEELDSNLMAVEKLLAIEIDAFEPSRASGDFCQDFQNDEDDGEHCVAEAPISPVAMAVALVGVLRQCQSNVKEVSLNLDNAIEVAVADTMTSQSISFGSIEKLNLCVSGLALRNEFLRRCPDLKHFELTGKKCSRPVYQWPQNDLDNLRSRLGHSCGGLVSLIVGNEEDIHWGGGNRYTPDDVLTLLGWMAWLPSFEELRFHDLIERDLGLPRDHNREKLLNAAPSHAQYLKTLVLPMGATSYTSGDDMDDCFQGLETLARQYMIRMPNLMTIELQVPENPAYFVGQKLFTANGDDRIDVTLEGEIYEWIVSDFFSDDMLKTIERYQRNPPQLIT
ncbi:hypothetical protein CSOJ01_14241 [Colletotrichum sojae]|uniref:Uncharacterized protein n=1 Tax=Colletotrichum sojae TaxID=2175907 RepID=A0A8H6IQ97_9PEZI|nr:hypothetical protein CSOJ01_14241 [Colletotrichum sojae]